MVIRLKIRERGRPEREGWEESDTRIQVSKTEKRRVEMPPRRRSGREVPRVERQERV